MHKILISFLSIFIIFLSTGCSPVSSKYRVMVDAITAPSLTTIPKNYTIQALKEETNINSLEFLLYKEKLNNQLQQSGYNLVDNPVEDAQIIYFDYGIEKELETTQTYSEPDITFGVSVGYPYNYYQRGYHPFWNDYRYRQNYTTYQKNYIYYNRYITLLAKEPTGKELWRVDVSSIGESKNLKKIIPLLIESATPYMGRNTQQPIKIIVKEKATKEE